MGCAGASPQLEAKIAGWRADLEATTDPMCRAQLEDTIAPAQRYLGQVRARAVGRQGPRRDPRLPDGAA